MKIFIILVAIAGSALAAQHRFHHDQTPISSPEYQAHLLGYTNKPPTDPQGNLIPMPQVQNVSIRKARSLILQRRATRSPGSRS